MIPPSKSQASQDLFAIICNGLKREGFFFEVGTNNPVEINNTYIMEKSLGWIGLLVDNSIESMEACAKHRTSRFLLADAAAPNDWIMEFHKAGISTDIIDYFSLDVDEATLDCLKNIPLDKVRFRVITIETDEYRFPGRRDEMVAILKGHGYDVLCADVCDQGLSFEIWAVDPLLVDMKLAEKFRRDKPTDWKEFFV